MKRIVKSLLNSYSQVFFSNNLFFAGILFVVSFFDLYAGICGLISVLITNLVAYTLGYNRINIEKGYYGFNSLLVGLGVGLNYAPNLALFCLVIFAAIFTFFVTVNLDGILGKYGLPYLSLPFVISLQMILIATRNFNALHLSERGIYVANSLYQLGGLKLVDVYDWWNNISLLNSLKLYFYSLGSIFFQSNLIAGILISFGLLVYSRIAFTLSIIGFYAAYFFFRLMGFDFTSIGYDSIGFNFILTSIALGAFFIVPSKISYWWVVLVLPIVAMLSIAMSQLFALMQVAIYSLPFSFIVISFVYALKLRTFPTNNLVEVKVQQYSPEKNLYFYQNTKTRFQNAVYYQVALPFWGEWKVYQSHNGEFTHKDEWKHALDFVVEDSEKNQFMNDGSNVTDYYCYNKQVLAPLGGYVVELIDEVEDNRIGDVNVNQNWGNVLIIKHEEGFYSKLAHLKSGSFKVKKGDYVHRGQILATVGNSGRSPFPHLHFQLQLTPYIGAKTIDYPLGYYLENHFAFKNFKSFQVPKKDAVVSNFAVNPFLANGLHFIPGKRLQFEVSDNKHNKKSEQRWEVFVDSYNISYIHCYTTNSYAYFTNDTTVHYFKNFVGDRKSLLYYFFLACFKVPLGFADNIVIEDSLPLHIVYAPHRLFLQDFISPFYLFLKSKYKLKFTADSSMFSTEKVILESCVKNYIFQKKTSEMKFSIEITNDGIEQFNIFTKHINYQAKCIRKQ